MLSKVCCWTFSVFHILFLFSFYYYFGYCCFLASACVEEIKLEYHIFIFRIEVWDCAPSREKKSYFAIGSRELKLYCKAVVGVHLHLCYNFSFFYIFLRSPQCFYIVFLFCFCNGTGVGSSFLLSFVSRFSFFDLLSLCVFIFLAGGCVGAWVRIILFTLFSFFFCFPLFQSLVR